MNCYVKEEEVISVRRTNIIDYLSHKERKSLEIKKYIFEEQDEN